MSSNSGNTVYVITGGNSGIGLGLVKSLLTRPATTVVATVRGEKAALGLQEASKSVQRAGGSLLYIMEIDFTIAPVALTIRERFSAATDGLSHVDIVICAAGSAPSMAPCLDMAPEHLRAAFEVNTIGPLTLFQALWPLMTNVKRRPETDGACPPPKFVVMSSSVGSIEAMEPFPGGAYGASKAAVNWIVKALHEQMRGDSLVSVALHPGWVRTRMGDFAAQQWDMDGTPFMVTVESSVEGCLEVIDKASRENFSGRFVTQLGEILPW